MRTVVKVKGLTKTYGNVNAIQDVSFSIESNKIYGLLGRNGAGKTTLMHLITAQQFASSGDIQVFGEHPYENNRVLSQCCFIKESQKYPDNYRINDLLEVSSFFFPNWDRDYAHTLIELFGLPLTRRIKKLSRGMLSSIGIVVGLASRAPLTMFDEPYLGLDAVARSLFYQQLIEDYGKYPRTIILSTHLIDEVSQMLEHVMVIDNGKLIIDEDADELRGSAFTVVGPATSVESFIVGRNVIDRKPFGGLLSATLMTRLSVRDQQQAATLGLEISSISLQQLIIHMTNGSLDGKVAMDQ
ncbi:ABC transporter ATP-binding protein [Paenibacillus macquariensis]|uniref:ABC-2 type transport system ATP-binding protein n=1 Tax=Paenibacillus macquariensis TaxID=948756 RepID=A0ABY1KBT6_9BACL|nr:ABC transporter ATP-binding protein [Paenibacillus macquariensis]MEC0093524.1 ABC transporter ATP-binding protein [Paenibacillus macquariensis]OAB29867.1 ABC transporter ATP-binding protein [Paenibacillus macquariensis subsp. macquariensis]SIR56910.1 ABC-2 type transport system ATP-binding protein [Paenibacillus macquariensis]